MKTIEQMGSLFNVIWPTDVGDAGLYRSFLDSALDPAAYKVQRVSRTVGRDQFHKIADSDAITVVTSHDHTEEAVVMMRRAILATLLERVADAAVKRANRSRPLMARLEGLTPLGADDTGIQVRYDTSHSSHVLHVSDREPAPEP